jgi:mannose-6-phosphate isomerase-like protein (cupin superfamily)
MQIKKVDFRYKDRRGIFYQITTGNWKSLNIVKINKGYSRGGHYHKETKEFFYVLKGKIELGLIDMKNQKESTYRFERDDCFIVDLYESHTVRALTDSLLIILLSRIHNSKNPDIFQP